MHRYSAYRLNGYRLVAYSAYGNGIAQERGKEVGYFLINITATQQKFVNRVEEDYKDTVIWNDMNSRQETLLVKN